MASGFIDLLSFLQGGFTAVIDSPYVPLTYPVTLPTSPGIRTMRWAQMRASARSTSVFSYITQIEQFAGEKFVVEVTLPLMTREQADEWNAWMLSLDGDKGTFLMGDPLRRSPRGLCIGTPKIATADQTGKKLYINGMTPNIANQFRKSDFIQLGDYRLHQVLRDASSDANGLVILDIFPRLRQVYPVDDPVININTVGQWRMVKGSFDLYQTDERKLYSFSFICEEAL